MNQNRAKKLRKIAKEIAKREKISLKAAFKLLKKFDKKQPIDIERILEKMG